MTTAHFSILPRAGTFSRPGLFLLLVCVFSNGFGQIFSTEIGSITFFKDAPLENIDARNRKVQALYNASTGELAILLLLQDFEFQNGRMREAFLTRYTKSESYPRASFSGRVTGDFAKDVFTWQSVQWTGELKLNGVTKQLSGTGSICPQPDGSLRLRGELPILYADWNVPEPRWLFMSLGLGTTLYTELHLSPQKQP